MTLSSLLILLPALPAGLEPGVEALRCPNPVSAWTGTIGDHAPAYGVAVDADDNIIVSGHFVDGADLDPTDGIDQRSGNGGHPDIFVTKVRADGSYAWSYTVGALDVTDSARGVALPPTGEIVVAGGFQDTVDFDPGPEVDEFTPPGDSAAFITRLAADGAYLSTLTLGGAGRAIVIAVAVDGEGNILLTGYFDGWIDFDPGPGVLPELGRSDIFVTKLGPDGSHLWTHTLGSSAFDAGEGVAVDSDGNVYVTGTFRGTVDFDPTGWDPHTMVGPYEDIFVSKYYPDGSYAWTRTFDARYSESGNVLAVAEDGGCLITSAFEDTVDFDPTDGVDRRTSVEDSADIFVTKLNADGSYGWTYTVGGPRGEAGAGVTVDAVENVFVTGYFQDSVDFDPGLRVDLHDSRGMGDAFLTKLRADGRYEWTRTFGGQRTDKPTHLSIDGNGNAFVVGFYWAYFPYPDYDPGCEVAVRQSHNEPSADTFIVKLVCPELSADFDGNGVVDLRDAAQLQLCFTDEGPATCGDGCSRLDLDPDDDIDLDDYTAFRKRLTGPQPRELITPTSPITTHRERPGDTSIRAPSASAGCNK